MKYTDSILQKGGQAMYILHVYLKVAPEKREAFLESTKKIVAGTVAEEGNISYHLYEDTVEPNTFILVEKWQDAESLKRHEQTPHFLEYVGGINDLVSGPLRLEKYEVQDAQ